MLYPMIYSTSTSLPWPVAPEVVPVSASPPRQTAAEVAAASFRSSPYAVPIRTCFNLGNSQFFGDFHSFLGDSHCFLGDFNGFWEDFRISMFFCGVFHRFFGQNQPKMVGRIMDNPNINMAQSWGGTPKWPQNGWMVLLMIYLCSFHGKSDLLKLMISAGTTHFRKPPYSN